MKKVFCFTIIIFLLAGCGRHIDTDPLEGAKNFCEEMGSYAKHDNYGDANGCLNSYLSAYSQQDQFTFVIAVNKELQKGAYYSVKKFIERANTDKYPSFAEWQNLSVEIVMYRPADAATLFCDKMAGYAANGDYVQASEYVSEFLSAAEKSGNSGSFFHALESELTLEYNRITKRFVYQVDARRFPVLFDLKCRIIASEEVKEIFVRHHMSVDLPAILRKKEFHTSSLGSKWPREDEIEFFNSKCPLKIDRSLVLSKVLFDEKKMEYIFVYNYTQPVDDILAEGVNIAKSAVLNSIEDDYDFAKRIRSGLTHLYIYRSVEEKKLYEIKIEKNDLKPAIIQL